MAGNTEKASEAAREFQALRKKCRELLSTRQYAHAVELTGRLVELGPNDSAAYELNAQALLALKEPKQYPSALKAAEIAVLLARGQDTVLTVKALCTKVRALMALDELMEAGSVLAEALARPDTTTGDDFQVKTLLGGVQRDLEKMVEAREAREAKQAEKERTMNASHEASIKSAAVTKVLRSTAKRLEDSAGWVDSTLLKHLLNPEYERTVRLDYLKPDVRAFDCVTILEDYLRENPELLRGVEVVRAEMERFADEYNARAVGYAAKRDLLKNVFHKMDLNENHTLEPEEFLRSRVPNFVETFESSATPVSPAAMERLLEGKGKNAVALEYEAEQADQRRPLLTRAVTKRTAAFDFFVQLTYSTFRGIDANRDCRITLEEFLVHFMAQPGFLELSYDAFREHLTATGLLASREREFNTFLQVPPTTEVAAR